MENAERVQTVPELFCKHRCPIVGEEGARQSSPHQSLAEAVHEALDGFVQLCCEQFNVVEIMHPIVNTSIWSG